MKFILVSNIVLIVCNDKIIYFYVLLFLRGGLESNCAIGYQGPLCGSCISGFSKVGTDCVQCSDATSNFVQILFLFSLLFFCVMTMIMYFLYHKYHYIMNDF